MSVSLNHSGSYEQAPAQLTNVYFPLPRPPTSGPILCPIDYAHASYLMGISQNQICIQKLLSISYFEIPSWLKQFSKVYNEKQSLTDFLKSSTSFFTCFREEYSKTPWPSDTHKRAHGKFIDDTKGTILFLTIIHEETNVILFMDTFESKKLTKDEMSKKAKDNENHAEAILEKQQRLIKASIQRKLTLLKHHSTKVKIHIQIKNSPCKECSISLTQFANYLTSDEQGTKLCITSLILNYVHLYQHSNEGLTMLEKSGHEFICGKCKDNSVLLYGAIIQWESLSQQCYNDSNALAISILPLCGYIQKASSKSLLEEFIIAFANMADRQSLQEIERIKAKKRKRKEFLFGD